MIHTMQLYKILKHKSKVLTILFLILISSFPSLGQLYIKGFALYPFFIVGDTFFKSYSIGSEYKTNRIAVEYHFNDYRWEGGGYFKSLKQQIGLKYYIKNSESKCKLYASTFFNYQNMYAKRCLDSYEELADTRYAYEEKAIGTGYGLSLGVMQSFGKHIGMEIAPYYYYLHTNKGEKLKDAPYFSNLKNRFIWGLRFYLYFKCNLN